MHCQTTYSRFNRNEGKGRVPWLSGTASWSYYSATHWLLGIRPEIDGLRIDPCIPKAWPGFTMQRTFRGKRIAVRVLNPNGQSRGVRCLKVDGREIPGNLVPVSELVDGMTVEAVM